MDSVILLLVFGLSAILIDRQTKTWQMSIWRTLFVVSLFIILFAPSCILKEFLENKGLSGYIFDIFIRIMTGLIGITLGGLGISLVAWILGIDLKKITNFLTGREN